MLMILKLMLNLVYIELWDLLYKVVLKSTILSQPFG